MEVILLENIINLGSIGDKVKVKDGYGRNYLLRQGLWKELQILSLMRATHSTQTVTNFLDMYPMQMESIIYILGLIP